MNVVVEKLLLLQKLEIEIDDIRAGAQVYPDRVAAAREREARSKATVEASKLKLQALEREHGEAALLLATEEERLKKSKAKVKQLKTNFEFQALQHEIENTKRANATMEDEVLKKMEEIDTAKKTVADLDVQWKRAGEDLEITEAEASVKAVEFERELSAKLEEHRRVEVDIDKTVLAKYRFIRDRRYRDAIVPVIHTSCQGCFMNIPHQLLNEILRSKEISTCPNCKRLIFVKEAG